MEYLPLYSPPHQGEQVVYQRATTTVVRQDQPIYHDPPPSYEEIFGQHGGRRQCQRQRRPSRQSRRREDEGAVGAVGGESQSQQDPPTAHRHFAPSAIASSLHLQVSSDEVKGTTVTILTHLTPHHIPAGSAPLTTPPSWFHLPTNERNLPKRDHNSRQRSPLNLPLSREQ